MKRSILAVASIAAVACMSTAVWAANNTTESIKLYQEPNVSAKVVETIKTDVPLITIYKNEGWSKVGDPSNGKTGWIQTVDLKNVDSASANVQPNQTTKTVKTDNGEKTVTKGTVQTPQGPMNYEIVQFQSKGDNAKVDKAFFKQLQQQQIEMNNVFANSWNDMGDMQMNMSNLMAKQQQQMMEMQKQFQQLAQQTTVSSNNKIELKDAAPAQVQPAAK
ncbi:SH3 domain-containing protein [Photobacterium angustum]|uniref:SH3 domain-containing protein n=1 Tax=Photobacterium angustum TaxID=661 RepID=UPI0005E0C259|nr:SH3 domain-containing protein [Photobacterium angustum]KJF94258.1 hypothetical protein UB39_11420 [Photobacterium angustum]PSW78533.1 SH3 domain-containing protein [Photobacterium angustum]